MNRGSPYARGGGSAFRGNGPSRGGFNRGRGGPSRGGRGSGGGFRRDNNQAQLGPPARITPAGQVMHPCEDQIVVRCDDLAKDSVPYFNGRVFLENKTEIGKIDEILGPLTKMFISIKTANGVKPESIPHGTKVFIDTTQQLPLDRFLPKPPAPKKKASKRGAGGSGGASGGARATRGGFRGGMTRGFGQRGQARSFRGSRGY